MSDSRKTRLRGINPVTNSPTHRTFYRSTKRRVRPYKLKAEITSNKANNTRLEAERNKLETNIARLKAEIATKTSLTDTTVASTDELTSFTCFPKLPREIQLMIWKLAAIPEAREVHVVLQELGIKDPFTDRQKHFMKSHTPSPAILHACADSRTEGLKFYKPLFNITQSVDRGFGMVYIDPKVDTICVRIPNHKEDWFNNSHGICETYTDAELAQTPWIEGANTFHFARLDLTHPDENLLLIIQPDIPVQLLIQSGKYPQHPSFFWGYFFGCMRREELSNLILKWGYKSSEIREIGGPCEAFLRSIWADFRIVPREEMAEKEVLVGEKEDGEN